MASTRSSPKKASKTSKTSKESKATPPRPRRISKPTPKAQRTPQGRFGSVSSSSSTLSADEVLETDLDDFQDLPPRYKRLLHKWAKLDGAREENADLKGPRVLDHPPHISSRRRVRHSSEDESVEELEDGDIGRVSFRHSQDMRAFITLHSHYRSVDINYFKQILHGTFMPANLTKLGHGVTHREVSNAPQEPKGITQMLQCFGVYAMAVIFYAEESARLDLTLALEAYRYRLANYSYAYKFDSLREYNYAFMNARRLEGQDNPLAWRTEDPRCHILLRLNGSLKKVTRPSAASSAPSGYNVRNSFELYRCPQRPLYRCPPTMP